MMIKLPIQARAHHQTGGSIAPRILGVECHPYWGISTTEPVVIFSHGVRVSSDAEGVSDGIRDGASSTIDWRESWDYSCLLSDWIAAGNTDPTPATTAPVATAPSTPSCDGFASWMAVEGLSLDGVAALMGGISTRTVKGWCGEGFIPAPISAKDWAIMQELVSQLRAGTLAGWAKTCWDNVA